MITPTLGTILNSIGVELVGSAAAALLLKGAGKVMEHFKKNGPKPLAFAAVGTNDSLSPNNRFHQNVREVARANGLSPDSMSMGA